MVALAKNVQSGRLDPEDITEEMIGSNLYTSLWPDPELLIRTSGEKRLSNFLLWQISYTEIILEKMLWPDFSVEDFKGAIGEYQSRSKRMGG
jgi:undecaprenyl diphosphate synthase